MRNDRARILRNARLLRARLAGLPAEERRLIAFCLRAGTLALPALVLFEAHFQTPLASLTAAELRRTLHEVAA